MSSSDDAATLWILNAICNLRIRTESARNARVPSVGMLSCGAYGNAIRQRIINMSSRAILYYLWSHLNMRSRRYGPIKDKHSERHHCEIENRTWDHRKPNTKLKLNKIEIEKSQVNIANGDAFLCQYCTPQICNFLIHTYRRRRPLSTKWPPSMTPLTKNINKNVAMRNVEIVLSNFGLHSSF